MGIYSLPSPSNTINMNSKIYIAVLVVSVLLLGEAEAGCNQKGCCYCHSDQGYVLTSGLYKVNCDCGYHCRCNHGRRIGYYGECVDGGAGQVARSGGGRGRGRK